MKFSDSLKKNKDFLSVYRNGKSYANKYLVMYVLENNTNQNRLGISASKKIGNSVVRHHITRLIRESYRLHEDMFNSGLDMVVVARVNAKGKKYEEIKDVQVRMLKEKRGINVYMALMVMPNTNVIELSASVQDAVKEAIEDTTGVKVNNVDIKIKNISEGRQNKPKVKEETPNKEENVVEEPNVLIPQENIEENATVENQEESNEQEIKEE